jgi:hypothetical protein
LWTLSCTRTGDGLGFSLGCLNLLHAQCQWVSPYLLSFFPFS